MPVNVLLVEGELDQMILAALVNARGAAGVVIESGGSKGSLAPKARDRRSKQPFTCYLRDRDFDFEPPPDRARPTVDLRDDKGTILGWRWCRHEIESYLLEPVLMAEANGCPLADYTRALVEAAQSIAPYEAARWTVAVVRKTLPPSRELPGRPEALKRHELRLPERLDEASVTQWALDAITDFRGDFIEVSDPARVQAMLEQRLARQRIIASPEEALLWCSGKDLFAALAPWFQAQLHIDVYTTRIRLRDWVMAHPAQAIAHVAEWQALMAELL